MRWEDTAPRRAINWGAAAGVPDDSPLYRVCILRVPAADSLPAAFIEFWRRVLTEGPETCSDNWNVLLFQMNLLGGGFTCVFTKRDLNRDEPPVFKFSSESLKAECYELPEREPGDPRAESEYQTLEGRCLDQIREAVRTEPVASLFENLRNQREFTIMVSDFYRARHWPLGL
ncbi:hypothetical protein [Zavarzinella formosa]|uniref:hypothetical protein n=1 Tax=Zavarzinella formosa TaxID=360055 RepID=UPI0002E5E3BC|nr:hypothetical protein [Zavarzinella formosa]